ncbi:lipopolysaccharide biosynthesis protein [Paenibacillus durus]|uniref:Sugar isomerase n=1 Tax=Paenibacillus durus ATCC 35681 TaxID=1333534 RepID=A0A0F7CHW1_PAEDU|nr:sugar isomerase [Paenibacillus durus]AKG34075.1 sugar isomerase [Paenibacillus durus ATCC 35681]
MKAKRSILNLVFGLGSQLITIVLSIFIPRLIMINYGSEANGLVSSVVQIIAYLALLEAGVGAASLQALYKPIAQNNRESVNSILSATAMYYKKTGFYYLLSVIAIAAIYPFAVKSELGMWQVMGIVLFNGLGGAINYYYQGKFRVYLQAEGKSYVDTSVVTIGNIINNLVRIVLLLQSVDIVLVQASYFAVTLLQMVAFHIYKNRHYKWLDFNKEPDLAAINQKNFVLVHELSYMIFRNTDVLVLTFFTNLKIVSVYVMYNMIFTIIDNIVNTVNTSVRFALGHSYHEGRAKFIKLYDAYELYFMAFVFSLMTVAYILILPFITLYTSGVNDVDYVLYWIPVLFVVQKLLINARSSANNVINIAGHFKNTLTRTLLESGINLAASLILVQFLGIYGVLLGTVAALLYRSTDIILYANRRLLERSPWITFRRWLTNIAVFIGIIYLNNLVGYSFDSYLSVILGAFVLGIIILPVYIAVASILEREVFMHSLSLFRGLGVKMRAKFVPGKVKVSG